MPLNIITAAEGDWFHSLSPEMQKQYLEEHPQSKYAKMAKSGEAEDKSPELKSVNRPGPDKHPAVVHHGESHTEPMNEHTKQVVQKLPKHLQTFFHEKEYEPNSPVRKKLANFAHNSVHHMVKTVVGEVREWKGAASALKDLASGTKYRDLDHHKREALYNTAKFIATVAFMVAAGTALEGGTEGIGELLKSGVGIALGREAMAHVLAKSGANAIVHSSLARIQSQSGIAVVVGSNDASDEEDRQVLTKFIQHFANALQHADINPNDLAKDLKAEESTMRVIKSKKPTTASTETAEKWSKDVTDKEKFHTPPGLFSESADKIAHFMKSHSDSLKQAIDRVNFYKQRGGKNLSDEEGKKLDAAMDKIRELFGKPAKG